MKVGTMTTAATSQGFTSTRELEGESASVGHLPAPGGLAAEPAAGDCWTMPWRNFPALGPVERLIETDVGNNRRADEQRLLVRIVIFKLDADRQPLHDLDEVARGVLRRQQCEGRSGPHREAGDPAVEHLPVAVHVDIEIDGLADAQIAQLRLLEIGVDPDLVERADRHQALPDLNIVAGVDVAARDDAIDLGDDVAIAKVELGQSEIALGGFELGLGLLDGRRICREPVERAVDVAFGSAFRIASSICFGVWLYEWTTPSSAALWISSACACSTEEKV